jgi:ABC-type sulfate transport system substrate-binding protein
MEPITVTFSLEDESRGYEIVPARVPIDDMIEFGKEVRDFIQGSDKEVSKEDLVVSIEAGSFAIASHPLIAPRLQADMLLLNASGDISQLDAKRRAVIESWQKSAKLNAQKAVRIVSSKFKISTKKWYIL